MISEKALKWLMIFLLHIFSMDSKCISQGVCATPGLEPYPEVASLSLQTPSIYIGVFIAIPLLRISKKPSCCGGRSAVYFPIQPQFSRLIDEKQA